jgi:hypothetical protein
LAETLEDWLTKIWLRGIKLRGEVRAASLKHQPLAPMIHFILATEVAAKMTTAMEIHDSYLRELSWNAEGSGYALFHAVIYRSEGQVFKDAQESGWQDLHIDFKGMYVEEEVADLTDDPHAHSGALTIDGIVQDGAIELPLDTTGSICLELQIAPLFGTMKIHANRAKSTLIGKFELETIWDSEGNPIRPELAL